MQPVLVAYLGLLICIATSVQQHTAQTVISQLDKQSDFYKDGQ